MDSNNEEEEKQEEEEKYPNIDEIKQDEDDNIVHDVYNFGQQYFYWTHYRNHHWFITPKYDNLKDELWNNDIYAIDPYIWNLENQNADDKLKDDEKVKEMKSNNEFKDKYEILKVLELLKIIYYRFYFIVIQMNYKLVYQGHIVD